MNSNEWNWLQDGTKHPQDNQRESTVTPALCSKSAVIPENFIPSREICYTRMNMFVFIWKTGERLRNGCHCRSVLPGSLQVSLHLCVCPCICRNNVTPNCQLPVYTTCAGTSQTLTAIKDVQYSADCNITRSKVKGEVIPGIARWYSAELRDG
jgi:hypothetical protein